ncbi:hypothetical protein [Ideonella sp. A 288]|uniref:hypothetical protein n=1 Tax=Ideonella sp. A 288 TaxID=1962181 RepID=UPI000B4A9ED1|nr:hypothetical protein [Ideonella sp. A 288]
MATDHTPAHAHADLLAHVADSLSTRTLNHFAAEARLDGESLKDAMERYEIDYAWHVLGSDRLHDATVSLLEARLERPATEAQKTCIGDVLRAAAAGQSSDLLMSFDNDVAERLATALSPGHQPVGLSEPAAMG